MRFVQSSATIQVEMTVTRFRTYPEDGTVEVWGYVGDYEVCVFLPFDQAQDRGLLPKMQGKLPTGRAEKS